MIDAPIIHFIGTLRYISSGLYATFHRDSTLHFIETRKQGYSERKQGYGKKDLGEVLPDGDADLTARQGQAKEVVL